MAATGKTPILLYGSTTATNTPSAGNLTNSSDGCEIAINVADKNLFFKDSTNVVNTVPIRQSSASSNGWLSSTDWSTFNSKVSSQWVTSGSDIYYNTGNVGIGTTPVAWGSSYRALEIKSGGFAVMSTVNDYEIFCNGYYNGSNYKYVTTNPATLCYSNAGAITWYTAPSGTAGDNITWTTLGGWGSNTNFTVSAGNLVIGTSGKGIDFSATAGTGTSELLADYEEGTWTPVLTDGTNTVNLTTSKYTKIGRLVTVNVQSYNSSMSGLNTAANLTITGLPFVPSSGTTSAWNPSAYVASTLFAISAATNGIIYPLRTANAVDYNLVPLSVFGSPSNMSWQFQLTYEV